MRKQYVPLSKVQLAKELCAQSKREQREAKAARQLAGEMTDSLKAVEKSIHDLDNA